MSPTKFYSRGAVAPGRPWRPGSPWTFGHPAILGAIMVCSDGSFIAWNGDGKDSVHRSAEEAAAAVRRFPNERKLTSAPSAP